MFPPFYSPDGFIAQSAISEPFATFAFPSDANVRRPEETVLFVCLRQALSHRANSANSLLWKGRTSRNRHFDPAGNFFIIEPWV